MTLMSDVLHLQQPMPKALRYLCSTLLRQSPYLIQRNEIGLIVNAKPGRMPLLHMHLLNPGPPPQMLYQTLNAAIFLVQNIGQKNGQLYLNTLHK